MVRKPIKRKWRALLGVSSVLLLMLIYTGLSHRQHQKNPLDTTMPTWSQLGDGVVQAFQARTRTLDGTLDETGAFRPGREVSSFFQAWIWSDTTATFGRLALGLAIGAGLAIILGLAMGSYAVIEAFFLPPVSFVARIPPTAMLAFFFVLVGTGLRFHVAMIAFGVLPILTQTVFYAVRENVPEQLIDKGRSLGASQPELIWNIIFKHILPEMIEAVRLQVGPALVYLIAAEWALSDVGYGYRLRIQSRLLNMNVVYVYLVILGIAGFTIDAVFRAVSRAVCPWAARK